MKLTKEQRETIIKEVIERIETQKSQFLCCGFAIVLRDKLNVPYDANSNIIEQYIPEFKYSTAKEYFHAIDLNKNFLNPSWWNLSIKDKNHRLKFLNYLLAGKLPIKKKVSKKK